MTAPTLKIRNKNTQLSNTIKIPTRCHGSAYTSTYQWKQWLNKFRYPNLNFPAILTLTCPPWWPIKKEQLPRHCCNSQQHSHALIWYSKSWSIPVLRLGAMFVTTARYVATCLPELFISQTTKCHYLLNGYCTCYKYTIKYKYKYIMSKPNHGLLAMQYIYTVHK